MNTTNWFGARTSALALGVCLALLLCWAGTGEAKKLTVSCGAFVGLELELCKQHAKEWAEQTGNEVAFFAAPRLVNNTLAVYEQILGAGSDELDVLLIDVIWPGLLKKHLLDLAPLVPQEHVDQHFEALVETNRDGERLLAIPYRIGAGLLYYRADLLEKYERPVPQTWQQLADTAAFIVEREKPQNPGLAGYVWQGKAYEGLTCNALEWLDSWKGGTIIDGETGEVTVDNPRALEALRMAASWVGTISPPEVLTYAEEDAREKFQAGEAVFMRNWPYAWALLNKPESPVQGAVDVAPLPKGGEDGKHTGTLGAWSAAVSAYTNHPEAAADLARSMTTQQAQLELALQASTNPTIGALYSNPEILEANPFMGKLYETFSNAVARPSSITGKRYDRVSSRFSDLVHRVLAGEMSPEAGLEKLASDLNKIKARKGW